MDGSAANPPLQRMNRSVPALPLPFAAERQYRWANKPHTNIATRRSLDKAFEERNGWLLHVRENRRYDLPRTDPRYIDLVRA